VPLLTTLHGHEVSRTRRSLLLSGRYSWARYALRGRRLMQRGDLFIAVSEAVRQRAIARGFPEARTIVHHVGVDLERLRPDPDAVEPGLVIHVGRLVEKKGTAQLLAAFATVRARNPAARLVVIGDGPLRARLAHEAAGLGDAVRFLGALPPDAVARWMQRAWLIAAPSLTASDGDAEGLPTVLVEAAASGLPAVATHHSGIAEVVADGRTGMLVPEGDIAGLADRILALLSRKAQRTELGRAARVHAERHFDLVAQTRKLEDHYDGLISRPA
jgi:glycosyltransferase involved in cell wall biosynthesis